MSEAENNGQPALDEAEELISTIEDAERAVDSAFSTGRVARARITQAAQLDAAEAVATAGIAMEADERADEATRIRVIAEKSGDRENAKAARKKEREARKEANAEHRAATRSAKRAYDAIKFSAPNKLGFIRVVQVLFALHIASTVLYLMLTSRDTVTYSVSSVMDWIMVVFECVAFWMFVNRYKVSRPFVIAMAAFGLIVPAAIDVALGQFNLITIVLNGLFYIFLIVYFACSKRVKATLVNELGKDKGAVDGEEFVIERRGWPFVRNLIIYFIVFSNLGHWMEMAMCQLIIMGVVQGDYDPTNTMLWRDWLFPFAMEGFAVVFIALFLYPLFEWLKKRFSNPVLPYVLSFIANALFCTVVEFAGGMLVNAHHELWDYSDMFCNIMGQVCLQNTMAFGVAASLITWFVYPFLERLIARVSYDVMNIVFAVVLGFGLIVWSLYIVNPSKYIDLGASPSEEEIAQVQRQVFAEIVDGEAEGAASLQGVLDESSGVSDDERQAIREHLDAIGEEYGQIASILEAGSANAPAAA